MKISDKLARVADNFQVTKYDNGFLVEVSGQTPDEDWASARIMVTDNAGVIALFNEYASLPQQN